MSETQSAREALLKQRRLLRRRRLAAQNAVDETSPPGLAVYHARLEDGALLVRPVDGDGQEAPAPWASAAALQGWRLLAGWKHAKGWALALQNEADENRYTVWHLDNDGRKRPDPDFAPGIGSSLLGEIDRIFTANEAVDASLTAEAFDARYAIYQALLSDAPTRAAITGSLQAYVPGRGDDFDRAANADPLLSAIKQNIKRAASLTASSLSGLGQDDPSASTANHILSFAHGVAVFTTVVANTKLVILAKGRDMRPRAAYVPGRALLVGDPGEWRNREGSLNELFARQMIGALAFGPHITRFLSNPVKGVGLQSYEYHIGHYLWNELSALDEVASKHPVSHVYVSRQQPEHFGLIDELIPAFRGKVIRSAEPRDWLRHTFNEQQATFKPASRFIGESICQRIVSNALEKEQDFIAGLEARTARLTDDAASAPLKILIGLRVENRCWPEQSDGYVALARKLVSEGRKVVFVFDGHNVGGSQKPILSATEGLAASGSDEASSLEAERRIVETVRAETADLADAFQCVDTLGLPVTASIAATVWADGFIAHWGAGLAKYKWIVNAHGLVFTSNDARTKGDIDIYDLPGVRENARASAYISQDIVVDTDDVKSELMNGRPWSGNFRIEPDRFADACADWIAREFPPPAPSKPASWSFSLFRKKMAAFASGGRPPSR